MLRSVTAKQLGEWMEFAQLEPFGEDREDARFGSVVQVLMNVHRNSKTRPRPFDLSDCVLIGGDAFEGKPSAEGVQSWQEMKMIAMLSVAATSKGKGN